MNTATISFSASDSSLIGYAEATHRGNSFQARDAFSKELLPGIFYQASPEELFLVASQALQAFDGMSRASASLRILFLRRLTNKLEAMKGGILERARQETALSEVRLESEFSRTINQIGSFIRLLEEGSWVNASLDVSYKADGTLLRNIRKMYVPVGPVLVFAAGNFPLAFSVAGGDTIAAIAAGCSVIVKVHNGHPGTSALVGKAMAEAGRETGMPDGFFSLVYDTGFEAGLTLAEDPYIKAVAFTGSLEGGIALMRTVSMRPDPIPVFAEMGSLNPVLLLPEALKRRGAEVAAAFASSIAQGCGQFCTRPGLFLALKGKDLEAFAEKLHTHFSGLLPQAMLSPTTTLNFQAKIHKHLRDNRDIKIRETTHNSDGMQTPSFATTDSETFRAQPSLQHEFFGPFALIICCTDVEDLLATAKTLSGQLTATVVGEGAELTAFSRHIDVLKSKSGRIIFNGIPTGVEVCPSMHHGGPFPAASSSFYSAVGVDSIQRFVRPLCFQSFPEQLLPEELKDENKLNILRRVNGVPGRQAIVKD